MSDIIDNNIIPHYTEQRQNNGYNDALTVSTSHPSDALYELDALCRC
jgi:uncharacterized protein YqkB